MMKAITLQQPWASLMAIDAKRIETRGRRISYRGELAIHAGKVWTVDQAVLCAREPFLSVLGSQGLLSGGPATMPFGAIVAVVNLVDVMPTDWFFVDGKPVVASYEVMTGAKVVPAQHECAFGNYDTGRYGWATNTLRRLAHPVPCRGTQATPFDLPPDVEALVRQQLAEAAA